MTRRVPAHGARAADVSAIFGITGDLVRVMTFRSQHRLEQRGLLRCPIVGVAVDDRTGDPFVSALGCPSSVLARRRSCPRRRTRWLARPWIN